MSFKVFLLLVCVIVMANFFDDEDDFSLSGLTQEGHENDVTVISDSDDNYEGLLACAKALETEKKEELNSKSDHAVVLKELPEGHVPEVHAEGSAFEISSGGVNVSNSMAYSVPGQEKNFEVCLINVT